MPVSRSLFVVALLTAQSAIGFQAPNSVVRRPQTSALNWKKTAKETRLKYPNAGVVKYVLTTTAPPYGKEGDVVAVSRGFARNYLSAKKLGVPASEEIVAAWDVAKAAAEEASKKAYDAAANTAQTLMGLGDVSITRAESEEGGVGEVTSADVLALLGERGNVSMEGAKVTLPTIDSHGDYEIKVKLHKDLTINLNLKLVAA